MECDYSWFAHIEVSTFHRGSLCSTDSATTSDLFTNTMVEWLVMVCTYWSLGSSTGEACALRPDRMAKWVERPSPFWFSHHIHITYSETPWRNVVVDGLHILKSQCSTGEACALQIQSPHPVYLFTNTMMECNYSWFAHIEVSTSNRGSLCSTDSATTSSLLTHKYHNGMRLFMVCTYWSFDLLQKKPALYRLSHHIRPNYSQPPWCNMTVHGLHILKQPGGYLQPNQCKASVVQLWLLVVFGPNDLTQLWEWLRSLPEYLHS